MYVWVGGESGRGAFLQLGRRFPLIRKGLAVGNSGLCPALESVAPQDNVSLLSFVAGALAATRPAAESPEVLHRSVGTDAR